MKQFKMNAEEYKQMIEHLKETGNEETIEFITDLINKMNSLFDAYFKLDSKNKKLSEKVKFIFNAQTYSSAINSELSKALSIGIKLNRYHQEKEKEIAESKEGVPIPFLTDEDIQSYHQHLDAINRIVKYMDIVLEKIFLFKRGIEEIKKIKANTQEDIKTFQEFFNEIKEKEAQNE